MATFSGQLRQGLPRVEGGEPWPAAGAAPITPSAVATSVPEVAVSAVSAEPERVTATTEPENKPAVAATEAAAAEAAAAEAAPAASTKSKTALRQGLPRTPGGSPWPAAGSAPAVAATKAETVAAEAPATAKAAAQSVTEKVAEKAVVAPPESLKSSATADTVAGGDSEIRRGLPRIAGGEPWPAAGSAPAWTIKRAPVATEKPTSEEAPAPEEIPAAQETPAKAAAQAQEQVKPEVASKPKPKPKPAREPIMIGAKSLAQWVKITVLGAVGAVVAAAIIVLAARGVTTLPGVPEFLEKYPGEYDPISPADPGFPMWARAAHFLNIFLMVLIIRSGLLVRTQQKPPAFWTPKKGGKKISINLWLHTSLDIIWVLNGLIFVVLLFVSGHWLRIVPTSWEVFPNAVSAMLQYLTLDWPAENGWVNYNSLQQLMYFIVIFIAAPLAIITGVRMSEWWPEKAERLNKIYPAPLARAIHFPTMLFFVLFIIVHVFLVISTGALRNLNHMFAGTDVVNWTGFWLFALAIAITAAGWFAMRPLILAPIANLFGRVSNR